MNIEKFIEQFSSQFEETDANEFQATTKFRTIDEWDSMIALSIMAMIDENYQVKLLPNEMKQTSTIQELFDLVKSKK